MANPKPKQENLKPFKTGYDERRNTKGGVAYKKIKEGLLDELLAEKNGKQKIVSMYEKVIDMALKGDKWAIDFVAKWTEGNPTIKMDINDNRPIIQVVSKDHADKLEDVSNM
jgi:hypothetical protein